MKINSNNYYQFIHQIGADNLSPGIKKMHEVIDKVTSGGNNWGAYQTYKAQFDKQFEALELLLEEKELKPERKVSPSQKNTPSESKPAIQQNPKKHSQPPKKNPSQKSSGANSGSGNRPSKKEKKAPFEKPKGKGVELISPEVSFIKRFALLAGKTKNKNQILSFIRSLQRAIAERRIRKVSKYAAVINKIQKQLIDFFYKMKYEDAIRISPQDYNQYLKISGSEHLLPSIRFIKAYIGIQEKNVSEQKANNLLVRIKKAMDNKLLSPEDKYFKQVRSIIHSLEAYLKRGSSSSLELSEQELSGLERALEDCGCQIKKRELGFVKVLVKKEPVKEVLEDDGIMTVDEARKAEFHPVHLTGKWLELIGKMCLPTHFLVYGQGGSGKSSWVLLFTQYLASLGYHILYVAQEQYNTPTFTQLLNNLNIVASENFKIVKELGKLNPKDFDFVVLDSKDEMNIQLANFSALKKRYPEQSFIIVSQGTKDGDYTGTGRWRNVVDVLVHAENGVVRTGTDKNRWGGKGEMRVF